MNVCKYCGSKNLYLEPRIEGQDVLTADMVSLKCGDCNKWLKWCPKTERQLFILKARKNNINELREENEKLKKMLSDKVLLVEDGSCDVDKLVDEDGWYVIVYRQGSNPPKFLQRGEN
jgi:hypothetical protein